MISVRSILNGRVVDSMLCTQHPKQAGSGANNLLERTQIPPLAHLIWAGQHSTAISRPASNRPTVDFGSFLTKYKGCANLSARTASKAVTARETSRAVVTNRFVCLLAYKNTAGLLLLHRSHPRIPLLNTQHA